MTSTFAIVGSDHWHADIHRRAFERAGARLVGVSGPADACQLGDVAGAVRHQSHVELLEAHHPDLVVVLGRHRDLPAVAADVVAAGQSFVLEKPCAVSADALRPVARAAAKSGVHATVPLANRYRAAWDHLERLGTATFAHFRMISGSPRRYLEWGVPWVLDPEVSGGGVLRNLGIHTVDAFCMLAGDRPVDVQAAAIQLDAAWPVEVRALALLRSNGLRGLVEVAYTHPDERSADVEWRIEGAAGSVRDRNTEVSVTDESGTTTTSLDERAPRYDQFAADALDRVRAGGPPVATLDDAVRALAIIDDVYDTADRTEHP